MVFGYVCVQIIGLVVLAICGWKKGWWYTHTNTVASILTMFGVLGTFLGIFIGLQDFDINDIQESIPYLLDGLKLAFLTSLVGIGSAITLKGIVAPLFRTLQEGKNPIEVERANFIKNFRDMFNDFRAIETSGEKNLLAQLVMLNTTMKEEGSETREILNDMKTEITGVEKALTGGDGSTVFAQLQELTSTVSEKVGEIAEKVGEVATGQLIDALKEVIKDFNKNLDEQFGDNFKQLNEAVGRTVEWQEQYRQQMDKLSEEFRIAAESIKQSETALADAAQSLMTIEDQSESLVSIAEKLDPILHTLNNQLKAFSELGKKADDAFPLIESRLNKLTTDFSKRVEKTIADSHGSMEKQRLELGNIVERNKEDIENHVNILHAALRKEVNTLNKSLEAELTTSLDKLAGHFQSLSEGFVDNYEELLKHYTEAMTKLQKLL